MRTTLVSTAELADHLRNPDWAVVDCRFDLARPDWGFTEYQSAHIPGSVYAHLDHHLSGPVTPFTGRHPLPDPEIMARRLSAWGIDARTQVVVYDTVGGAFAVRLWWLLRYMGHSGAAVLDGGFGKWQRENRPVAGGVQKRKPARFIPRPDPTMMVETGDVAQLRQDVEYRLIDARAFERYRGDHEPIDPIAGHIPGAINRFHGLNLTPDGTFLPPEILRQQFETLLDGAAPENTIVYCGSGVTSIHHILAMELAGLPGARLYPGSWSEWIRDPTRPIARMPTD
jgi:thiosulfate/3-mercaptopyruvate sulfurtransferase